MASHVDPKHKHTKSHLPTLNSTYDIQMIIWKIFQIAEVQGLACTWEGGRRFPYQGCFLAAPIAKHYEKASCSEVQEMIWPL